MVAAVIWDEAHLKALLRLPRHPLRMVQQEPWQNWIEARGGLVAIYDYLRTCALSTEQRRLLDVILAHPDAPAEFYADALYVSRRTYFRRLDDLIPVLLHYLNAWAFPLPARSRANLPVPVTPMVGAEEVMKAVSTLLLRPDVRLVTLTGPGGVGKTRLAVEVAWEVAGRFEAGAGFVPLAPVEDCSLLTVQIARSLGVETAGDQPLLDVLKTGLRERRQLLVLDNFEHLISGGPLVAELLEAALYLKVLVTSREPLNLYGEHCFEVPLLPLPDRERLLPLEQMARCPAVHLFFERAQAVCPDFALTEGNVVAVAEICHRLDGLPLAIELAAARARLFPPDSMRAQLERPLAFLRDGPRDKTVRHQALWNTVDWSYHLLGEGERLLFRRLAVFANGWQLEAAEAVCQVPETGVGLESLAEKSLVRTVGAAGAAGPRFQMLQTVREYAAEQLEAGEEIEAVRRRHAAHYLALVEEAEPYARAGRQSMWAARIEREHDNLRAALAWMLERGEAEMALQLVGSAWRFWQVLNLLSEGRRWIEQALDQGRDVRTPARIKALLGAGWLAISQGSTVNTQALFEEGLALARALGERQLLGSLLQGLGDTITDRDPAQARALFEESLAISRELGDDVEAAWALDHLGQLEREHGDYVQARAFLEESLTIFRELEHQWGMAWTLDHLGRVALEQGDWKRAQPLLEEALAFLETFGARWHIPWTLEALAHAAVGQGDLQRAGRLFERSLRLHLEVENPAGVAFVLSGFAALAAAGGEYGHSARLGGAVGAMLGILDPARPRASRSHSQRVLERALVATRAHLEEGAFAAAWAQGQAMTREEAIAFALAAGG